MRIYEVEAYKMREAIKNNDLQPPILDMFTNSKMVSYYWSDGLGDVTKSVSAPGYGRLSPSAGNWL